MKEALDRLLARLRMRLAKTPIPRFFSWWGTELLACLPERWRKLIAGSNEALLVEQDAEEFVVSRERERHTVELGRIARNLGAEAQVAEFRRLQASIQNPALRTIFCIPESSTLTRNLSLPAAAEDNLRQVLGFEMDRQTPFKADQVYFDSRIVARDSASRSLRVELIVLPKALLDPQLASIGGGAIDFDAVDVRSRTDGDGARRGINLLPVEKRARRRDMRLPLNLGLAVAAVLLLLFNMSESLSNRQIAVETMQAEVDKAAAAAREVGGFKKSLQDSIDGANFLSEKKRKGVLTIALLNDLTGRLNDDTYLERLSVERNQIQIQGQSKEAASLINVLGDSPFLGNPKLEGQIQPDPRTGKDRFTISAEPRSAVPAQAGQDTQDPGLQATVSGDGEPKEDSDGTP